MFGGPRERTLKRASYPFFLCKEDAVTLMGLDNFRDVDRVVEQALGASRTTRVVPIDPSSLPMNA
jgi:hypothetical protein